MSHRPAFLLFALCAFACSESEPGPTGPVGVPDASPDVVRSDAASTTDAADASVTDVTIADDTKNGDTTSPPRDAAGDASADGSSSSDASPRDALNESASSDAPTGDALRDGAAGDAPTLDVTSDTPSDATGDPTAPRFPKTGKYTILIPPPGDAGTTSDAGDGGAGDLADVYYPDPPDLHTNSYAFPIVLLLQGAKVARGFYSTVSATIAGYGFIVVVPDHMSNNIGGPGLYAELSEIAAVGAQMKVETASTTAPVRGVVDTMRIALMGHSYGGASGISGMANMCFPPIPLCTFTRPPEVVGGIFYGTNLATPIVGVPALDTGGLPVLLVQGDKDGKALPADGLQTYNQVQKRPKAYISLIGANHYGVTDVDNPAGADPEVNAQTLDHATGLASTGRWMGVFLSAFLNNDMAARGALRVAGTLDPNITITLAE